jgi:hypothetical protein
VGRNRYYWFDSITVTPSGAVERWGYRDSTTVGPISVTDFGGSWPLTYTVQRDTLLLTLPSGGVMKVAVRRDGLHWVVPDPKHVLCQSGTCSYFFRRGE